MNCKFPFALALLLAACGGESEDNDSPRPQICTMEFETGSTVCRDATDAEVDATEPVDSGLETGSEIGQTDQALTVDEGYGSEQDQFECHLPWSGSRCLLPKDKTFKIIRNGCTSTLRDVCAMLDAAELEWMGELQNHGFSVSFVNAGAAGVDTSTATHTVGTTTDTLLGLASIQYNTGEQVKGPGGNYQRGFNCSVELDFDELATALASNRSAYPTIPTTRAQYQNAYFNLAMHELGHCAGLGHHVGGSNVMQSVWPVYTVRKGYADFQNTWFNDYVSF